MSLSEWKECKLKDIADVTMGQSPKSENYNNIGDGKPFLQGNRTFGNKYPTFDTYTSQITRLAKPNDVIMSVRAPVGALNITPIEFCLGRGVCSIRMKNNNQEFLYHLLKYNVNSMINRESGTVFGSVNRTDIENLPVFVPCNDKEQQAIAEVLGSLDDKIELNRKMNKTLEDMAQAIFKSWFVDFDPVKAKAEGRTIEGLSQEILDLFPDSFEPSELGEIPKGWHYATINDVAEVIGGGTPSTKVKDYFSQNNEGIPWLSPKDLSGYPYKYISHGETNITELGLKNSSAKLMPTNSVVFSSRAPIGYIAISSNELCTNQGFKSLVPKKKMTTEYLYQYIKNNIELIEAKASGSTFKEISGGVMKTIQILIPNDAILKNFEELLSPINSKFKAIQKETQTLSNLRDTLLPKLISGELRIPDAEKLVEGVV